MHDHDHHHYRRRRRLGDSAPPAPPLPTANNVYVTVKRTQRIGFVSGRDGPAVGWGVHRFDPPKSNR